VPAQTIDGKAVAASVEISVRQRVDALKSRGIQPAITVVRVGDDPASEIYVRNKARKARELGIAGEARIFPADLTEEALREEIERLNRDPAIDGILVQLPLPPQINATVILETIAPEKDVDGFHPHNVGLLHLGRPTLAPCTPTGVIRLIDSTGQPIEGKRAVVIGRSDIVGKPLAAMLLSRNATVTVCHSRTRDLSAATREADILVAAIGRPLFVLASMIRPGAIVIDVGMNRLERSPENEVLLAADGEKLTQLKSRGTALVGDVDFVNAREVAGWITPVPGGVGPMTIAMLMQNTVDAAERRHR
jgi:methylenetetrahydrofolate dehydrogenase (NADP+) / methenyltetrahydrofolate cyclohydrolase